MCVKTVASTDDNKSCHDDRSSGSGTRHTRERQPPTRAMLESRVCWRRAKSVARGTVAGRERGWVGWVAHKEKAVVSRGARASKRAAQPPKITSKKRCDAPPWGSMRVIDTRKVASSKITGKGHQKMIRNV